MAGGTYTPGGTLKRKTPAGEGWRRGDRISGDTSTLRLIRLVG